MFISILNYVLILFREMFKIMETIYNRSQELRQLKMCQKKELQEKLNFTEQQLINITNQMKMKIHQMVDDVEDKVNFLSILFSNNNHLYLCVLGV